MPPPATSPLHQQPKFETCLFPEKIKRTKILQTPILSMLNEELRSQSPTSPLHHHKHHSRSICLPACFSSMSTHPFDVLDNDADHYHNCNSQRARTPPPRSPLPEIKDRFMHLISKIDGGVRSGRVRRRNASAEFSYDPSSYALNFEDDTGKAEDQLLVNGFSARLSASSVPTTPLKKKVSRNALDEILENEEEFAAEAADKDNEAKCRANGGVAQRTRGRSRHSLASTDFSYEPSSYARNFEDDVNRADEIISLRMFGGLLAQPKQSLTTAPPPTKCSPLRPEIAAFS
ncbi:uncharacterized protein [Malus domestica]|uniref:uncharacterized protein n=1 Tax=Malus domestica TaxID=3750 RepID=UPI003976839E